jgi:hypothetical protein
MIQHAIQSDAVTLLLPTEASRATRHSDYCKRHGNTRTPDVTEDVLTAVCTWTTLPNSKLPTTAAIRSASHKGSAAQMLYSVACLIHASANCALSVREDHRQGAAGARAPCPGHQSSADPIWNHSSSLAMFVDHADLQKAMFCDN